MSILTIKYDNESVFFKVETMFSLPLNFKDFVNIDIELNNFVNEFKTLDPIVQKSIHLLREPTSSIYDKSGMAYESIFFQEKNDTFTLKTSNFLYYGDSEKNILMNTEKQNKELYIHDKVNNEYYYYSDKKFLQQQDNTQTQQHFSQLNKDSYSIYTITKNKNMINMIYKNILDLSLFNEYYFRTRCKTPLSNFLLFNKKNDEPFSSLKKIELNNQYLYTFQFKNIQIDSITFSGNLVASIRINKAVFRTLRNHLSEEKIKSLKSYFNNTEIPSVEKIKELESLLLTSNELSSLINDRNTISIFPIEDLIQESQKKLLVEKNKVNIDIVVIDSALKQFESSPLFDKLIKNDFIQLQKSNIKIVEVSNPELIIDNFIEPINKIMKSIDFSKSELENNKNKNITQRI